MKTLLSVVLLATTLNALAANTTIDDYVGVWKWTVSPRSNPSKDDLYNKFLTIVRYEKISENILKENLCTEADWDKDGLNCDSVNQKLSDDGKGILWKYDTKFKGFCNNYSSYLSESEVRRENVFSCFNSRKLNKETDLLESVLEPMGQNPIKKDEAIRLR